MKKVDKIKILLNFVTKRKYHTFSKINRISFDIEKYEKYDWNKFLNKIYVIYIKKHY